MLLGVQFLMLKITVAPSLSKEEVFFLDCLPLKMRHYELETSCHIRQDLNPQKHCCENLKCCIMQSSFCTQTICGYGYESGHYNINYNLKIKIQGFIILPVVLYGCETLSLTLREKHRLKVLRIGR